MRCLLMVLILAATAMAAGSDNQEWPRPGPQLEYSYETRVRCGNIEELLHSGQFTVVNPAVTEAHFPVTCPKDYKAQFVIVYFNTFMTPRAIFSELTNHGLRPARIEELLTLAQNKRLALKQKMRVLALGSVWKQDDGHMSVPGVSITGWMGDTMYSLEPLPQMRSDGRPQETKVVVLPGAWLLDLYWYEEGFGDGFFFLAVPLNPSWTPDLL